MAPKVSPAHPNSPKVKGLATKIITLRSHALQNLPLTSYKKNLLSRPYLPFFDPVLEPPIGP